MVEKDSFDHVVKTTAQWESQSFEYWIIPRGVLCVELTPDKKTKIKIGEGNKIYSQLPYINSETDLSDYYTKEEIDNILAMLNFVAIPSSEIYPSKEALPQTGNRQGDLRFVLNTTGGDPYEYLWFDNKWISLGGDLSEYAKKSEVNPRLNALELKAHTHVNKNVLDRLTANVIDDSHKHTNKNILDATTASYTTQDKATLDELAAITVFEGATKTEDGTMGYVPAPLQGQHTYFLKGDGTWAYLDPGDKYKAGEGIYILSGEVIADAFPFEIFPKAATVTQYVIYGTAAGVGNSVSGHYEVPIKVSAPGYSDRTQTISIADPLYDGDYIDFQKQVFAHYRTQITSRVEKDPNYNYKTAIYSDGRIASFDPGAYGASPGVSKAFEIIPGATYEIHPWNTYNDQLRDFRNGMYVNLYDADMNRTRTIFQEYQGNTIIVAASNEKYMRMTLQDMSDWHDPFYYGYQIIYQLYPIETPCQLNELVLYPNVINTIDVLTTNKPNEIYVEVVPPDDEDTDPDDPMSDYTGIIYNDGVLDVTQEDPNALNELTFHFRDNVDKTITIPTSELPIATDSTLGGIIVGNNLTIDEDGVLDATGGDKYRAGEGIYILSGEVIADTFPFEIFPKTSRTSQYIIYGSEAGVGDWDGTNYTLSITTSAPGETTLTTQILYNARLYSGDYVDYSRQIIHHSKQDMRQYISLYNHSTYGTRGTFQTNTGSVIGNYNSYTGVTNYIEVNPGEVYMIKAFVPYGPYDGYFDTFHCIFDENHALTRYFSVRNVGVVTIEIQPGEKYARFVGTPTEQMLEPGFVYKVEAYEEPCVLPSILLYPNKVNTINVSNTNKPSEIYFEAASDGSVDPEDPTSEFSGIIYNEGILDVTQDDPNALNELTFHFRDNVDKTLTIPATPLPIASDTTLGGIKVGNNLTIDPETGVLDATGGGTTYVEGDGIEFGRPILETYQVLDKIRKPSGTTLTTDVMPSGTVDFFCDLKYYKYAGDSFLILCYNGERGSFCYTPPVTNSSNRTRMWIYTGHEQWYDLYLNDSVQSSNPITVHLRWGNTMSISFDHTTRSAQNSPGVLPGHNLFRFDSGSDADLYWAKFYENSALVGELVPVIRQSDNAVGMFNKVTETFSTVSGLSAGTPTGETIVVYDSSSTQNIPINAKLGNGLHFDANGAIEADGGGGTEYAASDGIKIESNVIKHTNAITSAASVFKKISYDAQGHITGTTNVTASDIPALNYVPTSMLTVTKNTNVGITPSSNVFGYVSGLTAAAWNFQQTDGTLFSQYYNDSWQTEIYMDYRTGQMSTRGKNNGTWQDWRIHLDSGNYTSYTVTKTGGGASGTWDINISGSAAKLGTANKGSTTKGIYLSGGTPQEMTYSLNSTVNSGTANCIAYYSGANAISSAAKVTYVNANNSASTPATVAGLHIESPTYGNTAANMLGGVAGVFSYGDGGPQIRFKDGSSSQAGALIFTADDAAATGTSWHFVSNESDWNVISKRFHAKTSISIGTDKPSTSYNLSVTGTSYFTNTITIKGTSSGNASINYASYGNTRNYTSIKFYDGNASGQGVQVGGGGLTVIGGGESAQAVFDNLSTLGWSAADEVAIVASDGPIYFMSNCDTFANRKSINIDTSGYLNTSYINMNISDQDNQFSTASSIIYSNSDKYLRRVSLTTLGSTLGPYVGPYVTNVSDGSVIHQNNYNSAGGSRPVHRFIRSLRTNKLAFTLPANITMEYSTNSGSSWTSFGYTDAQKAGPFISRHFGGSIAIGPTSGERTTSMQTRITITNDGRDCYIDQFYIWMSTSGHGTTVDIQYTTQSAKTTWVDWRTGVGLAGWSGPNVINVSELRYGNTIYSIRFIFKITSVSADYKTQPGTIYDIQAYGAMACWTSKNNMMMHDSLYTWDHEQVATFPAEVKVHTQLRVYHGNYGTILRSDGSDTYILLTDSGSAENGTWNNLRPFQISNSTGMVYLKQGVQVSSTSYGALSVIRAGSTNNAGIKFYNNGSTYLGSLALGSVNGTFVRFKTDESTAYEIIDRSVVTPTPSSTVTTNWNTASERTIVVTKGWMSYWNGAYNGSSSNLAYCNKGAFGTIITHDEGDYVKTAYNQGAYGTDYGILFTNPIAASTDTGGYAYRNAEMRAKFRPPSSSARGWAEIYLGNAETTNVSGSTGWIGLYNASGKLTDLSVADGSSDTTQYFPNVSGTILNSGNYLQYTRSIQKLYAATSTKGWRRILTIPASNSSGYTIGRYEFHFTRQWNNGAPESFGVRVICNYTTPIIHLLYAEQYTRILTDFRVTRSSDSTKIHFEVWYDSTSKNDFSVRYIIQDPYPIPHDYCTFPTETNGSSAGSSFLPVVSDNPTGQATIVIPAGGISQFNLRQVTGSYGGYFGMADATGSDSAWIRTTSQGLLPYQSGDGTSGGHCYLGTSGWYFANAYINRVYGNTADFECFQPRHSNEFSMKQISSSYVWFNYRLITDDKQGYTTEPTKPINQYWFGCGKARNALAKVVTSGMIIYPGAANTTSYSTTLQSSSLTANRTATLPNATGTIPLVTEKYNSPTSTVTSYNLTNAKTFKYLIITTKPSGTFGSTTTIVEAPTSATITKTAVSYSDNSSESSPPTRMLSGIIQVNYTDESNCVISTSHATHYIQAGSAVASNSASSVSIYITRIVGVSY